MTRPTKEEILTVIAEVEQLSSTLARFPGLSRGELLMILRGRARARPEVPGLGDPPDPSPPPRASRPALRSVSVGPGEEASSGSGLARAIPRQTKLIVSTDGASRGNPGPASIGVVLAAPDGKIVDTIARRIGLTTNNIAEYQAVRIGLERARELGAHSVHVRADSELAIRQLTGQYKVKNEALRPLFEQVKLLEAGFAGGVTFEHVRREYNRQADALASEALDSADPP